MKLYTRTGDDGSSGLFGGDRVSKSHLRLVAYGTLDELNSVMGLLCLQVTAPCATPETLQRVQHDLFVLGAILATPANRQELLGARMSTPTWALADMEADIDRLTALAPPMTAFVLPGGTPASAHAHLARTVCRRAEREVVALTHEEPLNPTVLAYLNRLSDWLFALARAENATAGVADVQWVPKDLTIPPASFLPCTSKRTGPRGPVSFCGRGFRLELELHAEPVATADLPGLAVP